MRWGVRNESSDDHSTGELCMKEITACQRQSMGPNFVVFNHISLHYIVLHFVQQFYKNCVLMYDFQHTLITFYKGVALL